MKCSVLMLAILGGIDFVIGRQWQTVIDHNIHRKSNIDYRRYELKIEADPYYQVDGPPLEGDSPTLTPGHDGWVTLSPTLEPSAVPSDSPSIMPSEWDIEQNGGCRYGHELFEVHMYDSWGDGWDQTMLVISGIEDQDPTVVLPSNYMQQTITALNGDSVVSIARTINLDDQSVFNPDEAIVFDPLGVQFRGSLLDGSHDINNVCLLPRRCYQVIVSGGEFLNEVSWDIRRGNLNPNNDQLSEPILGGGAPSACTFSLPDENEHHFCPNTCSNSLPPALMTMPPKLVQNLQQNQAVGSAAINVAAGEIVSTNLGTTRASYGDGGRSGGLRSAFGGSSILENFHSPENHNNN